MLLSPQKRTLPSIGSARGRKVSSAWRLMRKTLLHAAFRMEFSTSSRLPSGIASSGEYGSALRSAIEKAGLGVQKGQSPFHFKVTFPERLNDDLAKIFNDLFYRSGS